MLNSTKPVQGLRNNRGREWPFFTDLMYRPYDGETVNVPQKHRDGIAQMRDAATQQP